MPPPSSSISRASITWVLIAALLAASPARADDEERDEAPKPRAPRWVTIVGATVPGLVVHGTGHFLAGDERTAGLLLAVQGVGIGALASAGVGLAVTGASRDLVGPLASLAVFGGGAFIASYLADVYGVLAPEAGWGRPAPEPLLSLTWTSGYVAEPHFDIGALAALSARLRLGRWRLALGGELSPGTGLHREHLLAGYRIVDRPDRTWLELQGGLRYVDHVPGAFSAWTAEAQLSGRLSLERVSSSLRGAFIEGGLGLAQRSVRYPHSPWGGESLLLAHFAFGAYLQRYSELALYYDHRHDDFAAGLIIPGLGSGVAGHFGARAVIGLTESLGLVARVAAGSAYVAHLGMQIDFWRPAEAR